MNAYFLPGFMGLLTGLLLHWTGLSQSGGTRLALGFRRGDGVHHCPLRSGLTAVGWAIILTALLCWLAVIDVDTIEVLPLSLGAILGGALLGIAAGLCGFTPMSAFAGLGGGNALEALSVLAGGFAMTMLLPSLDGLLSPLRTAVPYADATLFKVTLDEPFLLSGGFLGQGCLGLIPVVIAMCIPSPKPVILSDEEVAARAEALPLDAKEDAFVPEEAPDDTFVALLEGEEPLVIDTEADVSAPEQEEDESAGEEDDSAD